MTDFGEALRLLKAGEKVARSGWNGKGMFLILRLGSDVQPRPEYPGFMCLGYIEMKTADDMLVPWLASQTDMLAEDWELVP